MFKKIKLFKADQNYEIFLKQCITEHDLSIDYLDYLLKTSSELLYTDPNFIPIYFLPV